MSIKYMSMAWKMPLNAAETITLLALSDHANDEGYCYPGYQSLMEKTKLSKPTLAKTLYILEGAGFFSKSSHGEIGKGRKVNTYQLLFDGSWFEFNPKSKSDELIESKYLLLIEIINELRADKKQAISKSLLPRKVKRLNPKSKAPLHEPSLEPSDKEPSLNIYSAQDEKPKKEKKLTEDQKTLLNYGVDGQLAIDFIKHRKGKRAPITGTAMEGIAREAEKAGIPTASAIEFIINAGWQGFEADWYFNRTQKSLGAASNRHQGLPNNQMKGGNNYERKPKISPEAWRDTNF